MATKKQFKISGTGCALVDYLYKPIDFSAAGFKKYLSKSPGDGGLAPGKLVFREEFDKFSGEIYSEVRHAITEGKKPVAINIGGPSIVSLIHAAQMLHGTPVEVSFFACRGDDEAGAFIENKLAGTPLKVGEFKTGTFNTPFTDVLSDPGFDKGNGERVFINNIGAAWELLPSDLDASFFESDIVVFGGTALVPEIHSALGELLKKAKANNAITIVNTVYDFLSEKFDSVKPWPLGKSVDTYKSIDLLITDMEEGLRLSGKTDVNAALVFFESTGVGAVIITHGPNAIHYFSNNPLFGNISRSSLPVSGRVVQELRQYPEMAGDTTGCGDNFVGGVIASIAQQMISNATTINLSRAIASGVASGGFTCFYYGGTFYEEFPGQKIEKIQPYLIDYLSETRINNL